jgi:endoglucanase
MGGTMSAVLAAVIAVGGGSVPGVAEWPSAPCIPSVQRTCDSIPSSQRARSGPARITAQPFYVDPTTPAAQQVREWLDEGRVEDAELVDRIASQPQPLWVTADASEVGAQVAEYVQRAEAARARPLLVAYNIPNRDCGSYSGGGAGGAEDYREWVAELASGFGDSSPLLVLEPDAIPQQISGCTGDDGRYELLAGAVDVLSGAGADVYVDAGHPQYVPDVDVIADALGRAGVREAAGFALNVSNFISTEENIAYGTAISERLGGAHFVIDTSRNGATTEPQVDEGPAWCNPPDREIGEPPTTDTGDPLVDALLWIKRPGESDGACRGEDPPAGGWYPDYALDLTD